MNPSTKIPTRLSLLSWPSGETPFHIKSTAHSQLHTYISTTHLLRASFRFLSPVWGVKPEDTSSRILSHAASVLIQLTTYIYYIHTNERKEHGHDTQNFDRSGSLLLLLPLSSGKDIWQRKCDRNDNNNEETNGTRTQQDRQTCCPHSKRRGNY